MTCFGLVRRLCVLAALGMAQPCLAGDAKDAALPTITLQNDYVQYRIGPDGRNLGFVDRRAGKDYCLQQAFNPFAVLAKEGKACFPTAVSWDGRQITLRFGTAGVTARLDVQTRKHYFRCELVGLEPLQGIEQFTLANLGLTMRENLRKTINSCDDGSFAAGVLALTIPVRCVLHGSEKSTFLTAHAYRRFGLIGNKFAVVGCPADRLAQVLQEVESEEGLPCPRFNGVWGRDSLDAKRSYVFFFDGLGEANADRAIEYAKAAGAGLIMNGKNCWCRTLGHYPINEKLYPHGREGLKGVVAKIKRAGMRAGLHFEAAGIGVVGDTYRRDSDAYVTPVPDRRLVKDGEATLKAEVDATATRLLTGAPRPVFPVKYEHGRGSTDVQIDDEIIHYGKVSSEGFAECIRGAYGTRPGRHAAGAKVYHLKRSYGLFLYDIDSTLMDEVARNLAEVFNDCGFNMIYFDGSEVLQDYAHEWYYNAKMQDAFYRRLANRAEVLVQGSSCSHFSWHMHPRWASADGSVDIKGYLDQRGGEFARYRKNLVRLDIGWYGLAGTNLRIDDAEYILGRTIGFDASVSWVTNTAALDACPYTPQLLELTRRYEQLRLAGYFPARVREQLCQPGKEFRLRDHGHQWRLVPVDYDPPHVVTAIDGKQNVWTVENRGTSARQAMEIEIACGHPLASRSAGARPAMQGKLAAIINGRKLQFDAACASGDTLIYRGPDDCWRSTAWGPVGVWSMPSKPPRRGQKHRVATIGEPPRLSSGPNSLRLECEGPLTHQLTIRTAKVYDD